MVAFFLNKCFSVMIIPPNIAGRYIRSNSVISFFTTSFDLFVSILYFLFVLPFSFFIRSSTFDIQTRKDVVSQCFPGPPGPKGEGKNRLSSLRILFASRLCGKEPHGPFPTLHLIFQKPTTLFLSEKYSGRLKVLVSSTPGSSIDHIGNEE